MTGSRKHQVRLIGGQWKRSKLPVVDRPGLRPTPDRVREQLFNWLGHDLTGWRCLDAFAGSGALGFEAASRGASIVVMLDNDPLVVRTLRESQQRLSAGQLSIELADALRWLKSTACQPFDLVLIDPPFASGLAEPAAQAAVRLLAPGGLLYVEAPAGPSSAPAGCELWRSAKAGAVHVCLWRRSYTPGDHASGQET